MKNLPVLDLINEVLGDETGCCFPCAEMLEDGAPNIVVLWFREHSLLLSIMDGKIAMTSSTCEGDDDVATDFWPGDGQEEWKEAAEMLESLRQGL